MVSDFNQYSGHLKSSKIPEKSKSTCGHWELILVAPYPFHACQINWWYNISIEDMLLVSAQHLWPASTIGLHYYFFLEVAAWWWQKWQNDEIIWKFIFKPTSLFLFSDVNRRQKITFNTVLKTLKLYHFYHNTKKKRLLLGPWWWSKFQLCCCMLK